MAIDLEADRLIVFHVAHISGDLIVHPTDTDVLAVSLGQRRSDIWSTSKIIMDCRMGNDRSFIRVASIVNHLEWTPGLPAALPGYLAFSFF